MDRASEDVYAIVRLVPAGQVVSYSDIGELLGMGPRRVGRAMADNPDAELPWWRVTNAAGDLPPRLAAEAARHWGDEGTPLKPGGTGAAIAVCRPDLAALAAAFSGLQGH